MQPPVFWSDDEAWGELRAQTEQLGCGEASVADAMARVVFALVGASPTAREGMRPYAEAKLSRVRLGRCDGVEVLDWALAIFAALTTPGVEAAEVFSPEIIAEFAAGLAWCMTRAVAADAVIDEGVLFCESRAVGTRYLCVQCGDDGPMALEEPREVGLCGALASVPEDALLPEHLARVDAWSVGARWPGLNPSAEDDADGVMWWA